MASEGCSTDKELPFGVVGEQAIRLEPNKDTTSKKYFFMIIPRIYISYQTSQFI